MRMAEPVPFQSLPHSSQIFPDKLKSLLLQIFKDVICCNLFITVTDVFAASMRHQPLFTFSLWICAFATISMCSSVHKQLLKLSLILVNSYTSGKNVT